MPVQRLGVEETAFPVAAPERRRRRARVLGVAAASTSTVGSLGRLGRAAGAHLLRVLLPARVGAGDAAQEMQERLPLPSPGGARLPRRAALTKLPRGQQAALLPRQGRIWLPERPSFVLQLVTDICSWSHAEARRGRGSGDPSCGASPQMASAGVVHPVRFAIDLGEPYLQLLHLQKRRAGIFADVLYASAQPPGCPRDRP